MTTMRYMVHDVGAAVSFYVGGLGFEEVQRFGQAIAIVRRGDLDLWLAGPRALLLGRCPTAARPSPAGGTAR